MPAYLKRKEARGFLLCGFALLCAGAAHASPVRAVFDSAKESSEFKWSLRELDPQLPADWSGYQFLVLELRASSPQRFRLLIQTEGGPASITFHPYQNVWVRAAIPLGVFQKQSMEGHDMASMSNRSHLGYFISLGGPHRELRGVTAIGATMQNPIGNPVLEIRSVKLAKESPGDAVFDSHPLVDEFGQWIDTKGKRNLDQLRQEWAREAGSLGDGPFGYCPYGGYKETKAKATGFFRVEQIGGKWWFVDPDGHLFFSTGADVIAPWMATPVEGRNSIFTSLPPADLTRPGARGGASFYAWNLLRRFGPAWYDKWADFTIRRMKAWGINTAGNWSDPRLWNSGRIVYTVNLGGWQTKTSYIGMPDVYSEDFAAICDKAAAAQCEPRTRDPYLLGYFTANEPPWPGREAALVQMILDGPDTATKRELRSYLAKGDTPEQRKNFVYQAYERYLDVIVKAVRKHDPNHLNLGMRFAGGRAPDEMIKASRVFDVYSLNSYDVAPPRAVLERSYQLSGRPLLIGEFHFGTPGRGLSAGLRQTANDAERGVAYRYYVEQAASMPALIGAHWFEWVDEPVTGRFDGENYNIGLVDVTDVPYRGLLEGLIQTHKVLYAVHSGKREPATRKAAVE